VIGYSTHVIVACSLPEDVVYKMTKTLARIPEEVIPMRLYCDVADERRLSLALDGRP